MPRFSANLTFLFTDLPFLDRFAAAARAGFKYVEYMSPYEHPAQALGSLLKENGLRQVLFNLPAGDWAAGDRGIAADPSRIEEFRKGVDQALEYAAALGVERVNCLAGKRLENVAREEQWRVLGDNLRYAALRFSQQGRTLLVEPINSVDIPGFFLSTSKEGFGLVEEVGAANLQLQYDVYHMQRMEGELTQTIRSHLARIGHIQIADNPGRHQPGTGEINYRFLLGELDRLGYAGYVGLEYVPEPNTVASLAWVREHGFSL